MRRSNHMTRESLSKVRALLGEIDDIIYHDVRSRAVGGESPAYTEDEVKLTAIVDEAQGQSAAMAEACGCAG
jgi:hypothetical protein